MSKNATDDIERVIDEAMKRLNGDDEKAQQNGHNPKPDSTPIPGIIDFNTVTTRSVEWLWKPYLPKGKIIMFEGEQKKGKTVALLDILARLSTKQELPDRTRLDRKINSLYIFYEDDEDDTIVPRLKAAGADLDRVKGIHDIEDEDGYHNFSLSRDSDKEMVRNAIQQKHIEILVIDPITEAFSNKTDIYKETDVRRALAWLRQLARETGVTIILVRHHKKGKADNMLQQGSGSGAFTQVARGAIAVYPDSTDETEETKLFVHVAANNAKEAKSIKFTLVDSGGTVRVKWGEYSELTKRQILDGVNPTIYGDLRQSLLELFKPGHCWFYHELQERLQAMGYKEDNIKMAINRAAKPAAKQLKKGEKRGQYCPDEDIIEKGNPAASS